jgi:hypothetical protein
LHQKPEIQQAVHARFSTRNACGRRDILATGIFATGIDRRYRLERRFAVGVTLALALKAG